MTFKKAHRHATSPSTRLARDSVAPSTTGNLYDGDDALDFGHDDTMFSRGAVRSVSLDNEEQWASLIPKLVKAYITSCAYKKPDIVMVLCGCEATTVKKVTCNYLTRLVERELPFCPCHDGETLLKKYHLFQQLANSPRQPSMLNSLVSLEMPGISSSHLSMVSQIGYTMARNYLDPLEVVTTGTRR
ncbi:unnamed protein product [Absidia cylindrospora]